MNLKSSSASPLSLLLIITTAAALWGGQYMNRSLWEPDEARYTYVAKEMSETGNWFIPHRNGEPYTHKPPLMFWLINAGTSVTKGEFNGVSGRLPTFLGIVLSLWAVSRLAALWYDRRTSLYSVLILSTSFLFWHKAGTGQIDMLLLGLELSAVYLLFRNEATPSNRGVAIAFSLMGLAILAKGPVGLIVPAGIYISAGLFSGNRKNLVKRYWLWGIPLALLWPAAWLFAAWITGAPSDYFNELLFTQNVGRLSGEFGGHNRPFYYYLKYLAIDFLPWILLLPGAVNVYKEENPEVSPGRRILGWVLFVVIFFSLARSKRNLYILSVYPALSMFLASTVPALETLSSRWRIWVVYPLVIFFFLTAAAGTVLMLPIPGLTLPVSIPWPILFWFSLILWIAAAALYCNQGRRGPTRTWIHILVGVLLVVECYAGTLVFPVFNSIKSPMALAQAVETSLPANQKLMLYRLHGEILALYSRRQGVRIDTIEDLDAAMKKNGSGIVTCYREEWNTLEKELSAMACRVSPHFFTMGSKDLMWFEYRCREPE